MCVFVYAHVFVRMFLVAKKVQVKRERGGGWGEEEGGEKDSRARVCVNAV